MIKLRISNRIHVLGEVPDTISDEICRAFTYDNPDYAKAQAFGFYKRVPKYIQSWARGADGLLSVPRGGYQKLVTILNAAAIKFVVDTAMVTGSVSIPASNVTPFDYQTRMIDAAIARFADCDGVCLWRSSPASGKTTAALMLATIMRVKTIVIISNSVLMRQWCDRIRRELGIEPGIVGGGKRNLDPPIVVAMQQSICKLSDRDIARFGLLIGDEIQQFGAATFQESVNRFPARYRLGVSGDEHRADRKECLIYDQFGPVSVEVKADELVSCGRIHEVEIRIVPTEFKAEWWSAIDAMKPRPGESFEKAAQRRAKAKIAMAEKLASELASDQDRNDLIVSLAKQSVADTGRVMVLSTRREHCHVLDSRITAAGLTSGLLIGGADYREEFARTLRAFTSNSIQAAVGTYQAIGVGFDLPVVARGIFASPVANSPTGDKQWRQYRGRFARTADGKGDAALYYIWDQHVFGLKPLRHLARWNARVVVWDGQAWIPIKQWMVRIDGPKTKRHSNFATANSSRTAASSDSASSSGETAAVAPTTASDNGLGIRRRLRSEVTKQ